MKFELEPYNINSSNEELLKDLKEVALTLNKQSLSHYEYQEKGRFAVNTFLRRFGSWNEAIKKAGLYETRIVNNSDELLLLNIEQVWIKLGRQPRYHEMTIPFSKFAGGTYQKRFGTFRKALEAFVDYINSDEPEEVLEPQENSPIIVHEKEIIKHKTKRNISARLKVQVLMRDGNKCKLCGITVTGVNIHFDHIKPWAKGGETVLENLQVLCKEHNLAKGGSGISGKLRVVDFPKVNDSENHSVLGRCLHRPKTITIQLLII